MNYERRLASVSLVILLLGSAAAHAQEFGPRAYAPHIVAADAEWTVHVEGPDGQPLAGQKLNATVGRGDAATTIEVVADDQGTVNMPTLPADECVKWVSLITPEGVPIMPTSPTVPLPTLPPPPPPFPQPTPPPSPWTPPTFSPGGPVRVTGQGVGDLSDWELVPEGGGAPQELTPLCGSPYEQMLRAPTGLPDGAYRVRGHDAAGNPVDSQGTTWPVSLSLKGETRVREGTGGTLVVSANRDTWVHVEAASGIQLATNDCYVKADEPAQVPFKAPVRGTFQVRAEATSGPQGGDVKGKVPKATLSLAEDPVINYNPATDTTVVRQDIKLDVGRRGPSLEGGKALVGVGSWGERPQIEIELVSLSLTGVTPITVELPGQHEPDHIGTYILDVAIPEAPNLGLTGILATKGDELCHPPTVTRKPGDTGAKVAGGSITLTYEPKKDPCCTKLVWIQVMQELVDGKPVKPSKIGDGYMDADTTASGHHVDYKKGEKDPYYNGDDKADKFKGNQQGNTTGPKNSTMSDTPNLPKVPAGAKKVEWVFESWAFCAEGPCKGTWFKGRKWKYTKEKGKPGKVTDEGEAGKTPSKGFKDALDKWCKNHKFNLPKK